MLNALRLLARQGRYTLAAGLAAGLVLPGVAAALKPGLPHLVVFLLFLTAIRIGPRDATAGLKDVRTTLRVVLIFQLALPLAALTLFGLLGVAQSPYAMAVVLVLAAPALTGSPNLSIMLGADPEPAFRLLILGTALLPVTMLPVFWMSPQLGDLTLALWGSLRLLAAIWTAITLGFLLRVLALPDVTKDQTEVLDGIMTLALAVIVIGLMGALGPTLIRSPVRALTWLALALAVNLGMQVLAYVFLKRAGHSKQTVPYSIVAGNRNVALFLVTMSPAQTDPLLIFLGCYQVPMYLTPILMRRFYRPE